MRTKRAGASATKEISGEVDAFMAKLKHPLKAEIETARRIILGASPKIGEAIKWNAPSFRTHEFFATFHLRTLDRVQLVFHLGAKVRSHATADIVLADPSGLVKWLAKDRCLVTLGAGRDIDRHKAALEMIVREWIKRV